VAQERFLRSDPGLVIGDELEIGMAAFAYEAQMRKALTRLKYGGMPRLARPVAHAAFPALQTVETVVGRATTLVPIPVHASRLRDRGYNQAALLARELGRAVHRPVAEPLERRRPTEKQHRLNRAARLRNLEGAFAMAPDVRPPVNVILIDDILTTSATFEACARVLRSAGCERVAGFAIAREL
jgi:ComF family protein